MRKWICLLLAAVSILAAGCGHTESSAAPDARKAQTSEQAKATSESRAPSTAATAEHYSPPTAEEMAPLPPAYREELTKIHEPPEMLGQPMQVRKPASRGAVEVEKAMNALGSPDKATHEQRATANRQLLAIVNNERDIDGVGRTLVYGVIALTACFDGADPQVVAGYASHALSVGADALALRARMYQRAGQRPEALNDLEKIMAGGAFHVLSDGGVTPRSGSAPCGWSIADFDAFGDDPRALAAKGLYLSSFIAYAGKEKGGVKESDIVELYARAARSWRSPIPHYLELTLYGLGSEHSTTGSGCIRETGGASVATIRAACAKYDEGIRKQIRALTMALLIDPTFAPALSERASTYLQLAQASYSDGKPSRQLFELAIKDFTAAIAAGAKNLHTLNCDRALALASIGRYREAAAGYLEGMKYAKNEVEDSPFVYQQLAGLYMKLGQFNDAADLMTQAIMHSSGGGMETVIFGGGLKAFRTLYPEYDLLPDEILAEDVRRRYEPQFPQSWDSEFISKGGSFNGKVNSSILTDLFALRGDAYMKAGRRAEALADYKRIKSDAWSGEEPYLPRQMYFNERGARNRDMPTTWPPPPATF
jgi:tetratricopeptide (TPR) repeat protein